MEILEVPTSDREIATSVENSTAVDVLIFIMSNYHQVDFSVGIKQIEKLTIPLRDSRFSHPSSLPALLHTYGLKNFRGTVSVSCRLEVSSNDATTPLTCAISSNRQVLANVIKDLLRGRCHRLKAMLHLHVKGDVRSIDQHSMVFLIVREDAKEFGEARRFKPSKPANEVTRIMCHDAKFLTLMEAMLNFTIAFEKEYSERLVATRNLDIVKSMTGSDFLAGMTTQFYYQFILPAKMVVRSGSVFPLVKSPNSCNAE